MRSRCRLSRWRLTPQSLGTQILASVLHIAWGTHISNVLKTVQSRVFNQISARTCGRNAIYDDVKMDRRMTNDGLSSLENQQNL